jgi:DNA-binding response OmpR family regulator
MVSPKIIIIEKSRRGIVSLSASLMKRGYSVVSAPGVGEAEVLLGESRPDLFILDTVSLQTSGTRLARHLSSVLKGLSLIVVSAENSRFHANGTSAEVMTQPFTIRKLSNRIDRLLPGDEGDCVRVGPIILNIVTRRVQCNNRAGNLTPLCSDILRLLMDKQGKVVRRETLMKRVWRTEYMGDTRTLDVHISWIRKAIEKDPSRPRLIKTIRGVGFRLDL